MSIFVDVDAGRTIEFVKRLKASPISKASKFPLLILAKAVHLGRRPQPQRQRDLVDNPDGSDSAEIHVKRFMNLGIAAERPAG